MRLFKILAIAAGAGLFAYILWLADPGVVLAKATEVGAAGVCVILGVYLAVFVVDSLSWHLTLVTVPVTLPWIYRSWKVRMVGEAFNMVLPAGGMGGEPVKAMLLKHRHGLEYREGIASLILAKTINLIGLVVFLGIGFGLVLLQPAVPASLTTTAGVGAGVFTVAIAGFFAVQRWQVTSRIGNRLSRMKANRSVRTMLDSLTDMDHRLMAFYTGARRRFVLALFLATGNWVLGAVQIYYAARFLGSAIPLTDAWIIEAMVQMVRAGTFFIPASVGAQEGIFWAICTGLGLPASSAMAIAVLRRGQEIVWIVWGLLLGVTIPGQKFARCTRRQ